MTTVRIYQPSKTAMQSGKSKTKKWRVTFETEDPLSAEPVMGWIQAHDMSQELQLFFPSLDSALRFVTIRGLSYTICNPSLNSPVAKNYAFNFLCPRVRGVCKFSHGNDKIES